MRYTKEYAEILDKIFNYYVEYEINKSTRESPSISLFVKRFNISKPIVEEAISEICTRGTELELLKANKSGYGDWDVISMNEYKCLKFQKEGGFIKLNNDEVTQIEQQLINNTRDDNIRYLDLKLKKWQVKTKYVPYLLSVIALIVSIAVYFRPENSSHKILLLEQRIEQMDLEITSLKKSQIKSNQNNPLIIQKNDNK